MRRIWVALAAAFSLYFWGGGSGWGWGQTPELEFEKLDTNRDGVVSAAEVPPQHQALFERLLAIAGRQQQKELNRPLFSAALKVVQSQPAESAPRGEAASSPPASTAAGPASNDELFRRLDRNGDGRIERGEIEADQMPWFERLVRRADRDGNGQLDRQEFDMALQAGPAPRSPLGGGGFPGRPEGGPEGLRALLQRADTNGDGKLSKDEAPPLFREQFDRLDRDRDGFLTQEEFLAGARGALGGRPDGLPPRAMEQGQLEELFARADKNGDGRLTRDEIPAERRGIVALFERLGVEALTKEQFLRGMQMLGGPPPGVPAAPPRGATVPQGRPGPPASESSPRASLPGGLFAILDTDHDGQLSTPEIVAAGTVLWNLDRNRDGRLTPEEIFGAPDPAPRGGRPAPLSAAPPSQR